MAGVETLRFVSDLDGLQFADSEGGRTETTVEVCRDGKWKHGRYGDITVTPQMRQSFARNFEANVRKVGELPIDYDHQDGPAAAWIFGLRNEGERLLADVWLTPSGAERVRSGEYRKFSPEWHPDWEDPESGKRHGPTLFGGAFTNKPFFRGMAAVECSEGAGNETETEEVQMAEPETGVITADEASQLREQLQASERRLTAIETENAVLRAAEERRGVEGTLASLRFNERQVLAPASRTALTDALLAVPREQREAVIAAVQGLQFAELGERGFSGAEDATDGETLSASEEERLKKMAEGAKLPVEEVRRQFLEVRRSRRTG